MIKNILVPIDNSQADEYLLGRIRPILCHADIEVILLYVLKSPSERENSEEATESAQMSLQHVADKLKGVCVRTEIRLGDPAEEICKFAQLHDVSLIAMFTHAREGLKRFIKGSVAERVLRRVNCPLLLTNPHRLTNGKSTESDFKRILVTLDGSETSAEIIEPAVSFATLFNSKITLFHEEMGSRKSGIRRTRHSEILEPIAHRLKTLGIEVETQSSPYGAPAESILEQADRLNTSLIAMTTHGRSGVARSLFGSVAEAVIRQARQPVLIQRVHRKSASKKTPIQY